MNIRNELDVSVESLSEIADTIRKLVSTSTLSDLENALDNIADDIDNVSVTIDDMLFDIKGDIVEAPHLEEKQE
jgi:hypothetical protein